MDDTWVNLDAWINLDPSCGPGDRERGRKRSGLSISWTDFIFPVHWDLKIICSWHAVEGVTADVWIKMLQTLELSHSRGMSSGQEAFIQHRKNFFSESCSIIYSCASMVPWTGAVFFRKLLCSSADVLWYRTRSIAPPCLRNNWVWDNFFFFFFKGKANCLNRCMDLFSKNVC